MLIINEKYINQNERIEVNVNLHNGEWMWEGRGKLDKVRKYLFSCYEVKFTREGRESVGSLTVRAIFQMDGGQIGNDETEEHVIDISKLSRSLEWFVTGDRLAYRDIPKLARTYCDSKLSLARIIRMNHKNTCLLPNYITGMECQITARKSYY